ncbi:MAG: c-type cytochrome, partial [Rhodospirillales bacterium]|nr:c-type cytochrome [Rhodospirillales bacterium]
MHYSFLEKLGGGLLITAWLIWIANMAGDYLVSVDQPATTAKTATGPAKTEAKSKAPAKPAESGDALALLAGADAKAGEKIFTKCKSCHTSDQGGKAKVGPNLWDIVGRAKAAAPGFKYSNALKDLGGNWTYQDLDQLPPRSLSA